MQRCRARLSAEEAESCLAKLEAITWDGKGALDVWAALDQACRELGYTEERFLSFWGDDGDYPDELLARIMSITSCDDVEEI